MFEATGGLDLKGDHLDFSYRKPDEWPSISPKGSLKSFGLNIGDPIAGPEILLGLISNVEGEVLDWKNEVDPIHYHGTDQFRVLASGDWDVAGRVIPQGGYNFQESGWTYQEHPIDGAAWAVWVMGDRRGSPATIRQKAGAGPQSAELYGLPVNVGGDYPHPAGPKGIAAIATTIGSCDRGYIVGKIDELKPEAKAAPALTGLLGDEIAGPVVHVVKSGVGETAIPAATYDTELFFLVVAGSCKIGDAAYQRGDMRVQRASAPMAAAISGADGLEAILVVADRRAKPAFATADAPPAWFANVERTRSALNPAPGGPQRAS